MKGRLCRCKEFVGLGFSLVLIIIHLNSMPSPIAPPSFSALFLEELVLRSHHLDYLVGLCQWRHWLELRGRSRESSGGFFSTQVPWF